MVVAIFAHPPLYNGRVRLKVTIDVPEIEGLDLDTDKVIRKVARAMATRVRQRLRAGQAKQGALPNPKSGGKPFRRTGDAIRSVKAGRVKRGTATSTVMPRGYRQDGQPNEVVFASYQKRTGLDLMGMTEADESAAQTEADKEIHEQIARSETGGLVSKQRRMR
jgi:hypothetical protein